ncbi:recombinase family protein [Streptomyces sioyaensis]|uniref:recombinase family protein n=1 Tax=Streptomyces sioyaensis TaxID=67364 RepID=UPI0037CECFC9
MRAVSYIGQSKRREDDSRASPEAQREKCEALITAKGWDLAGSCADVGRSGCDSNVERPEFEEMMTAVRAGHVDAVVVFALSRLTRQGAFEAMKIEEELRRRGVLLVSVEEPSWTDAHRSLAPSPPDADADGYSYAVTLKGNAAWLNPSATNWTTPSAGEMADCNTAAIANSDSRTFGQETYRLGLDGHLWKINWSKDSKWTDLKGTYGGDIATPPKVVWTWDPKAANTEVVQAWALDHDGHMVRRDSWKDSSGAERGQYYSQHEMGFPNDNTTFQATPEVRRWAHGLEVFAIDADGNMWYGSKPDQGDWAWHNLGNNGAKLVGSVSYNIVSPLMPKGSDLKAAYAIDVNGNLQAYQTYNGKSWWQPYGKPSGKTLDPKYGIATAAVAAQSFGGGGSSPGFMDIYAGNTDGSISFMRYFEEGGKWQTYGQISSPVRHLKGAEAYVNSGGDLYLGGKNAGHP